MKRTPINKALAQLNNAGNNLFDAGDAPNRTAQSRERLRAARTVALSLAHLIEYGSAYKAQFTGAADELLKLYE